MKQGQCQRHGRFVVFPVSARFQPRGVRRQPALSVIFSLSDNRVSICSKPSIHWQQITMSSPSPGPTLSYPIDPALLFKPKYVRRRSSTFRPSNLSYPVRERFNSTSELVEESIGNDCGLESLPYSILLLIFVHLKTKDLLNLCLLSKYTYLPAAVQLYKKIVIIDSYEKYDLLRAYLQDVSLNLGTFIRASNLAKLYQVINTRPKLCQIIKSIIYVNYSIDDNAVFDDLRRILETVKLNEFFIPHVSLHDISLVTNRSAFDSIQRLGITTGFVDFKNSPAKLDLPLLSHLKIYYEGEDHEKQMALLLNLLGTSFDKLQFLEFQKYISHDIQPLQELNQANNLRSSQAYTPPAWVSFLQLYRRQSENKLHLTGLGIDGFIGNTGILILQLLSETIDLENLRHLQLNTREFTHGQSPHFIQAFHSTFLYDISAKTPNLTKLAVNPTHDCLLCQRDCLLEVISRRFTNKLTTLVLNMELPDIKSSLLVNAAVSESQGNLINLKIFDKSKTFQDKSKLFGVFSEISPQLKQLYEHAEYYEADIKKNLFSNYFLYDIESISSSIVNEHSIQELLTYRTNSIVIDDYMVAVIDLVRANPKFTQFLVQYLIDNKHADQIKNCPRLKYFQVLGFPIYIETSDSGRDLYLMKNFGDPYYFLATI